MVLGKLFSAKTYPTILIVCFLFFSILSWILLFRDIRALNVFGLFYPEINNLLQNTREFLLHKGLNTIPTLLFAAISLTAFYCYFKSLTIKISGKRTIIYAVLFQLVVFFSYPILSTDVFSYIVTSRVASVHDSNIWKVSPDNFPQDSFLQLSDWKTVPGIYGYADQVFYNTTSYISQNNLFLNLLLNKLLVLVFAILTLIVTHKIFKQFYEDSYFYGIRLIFWNPLFLLEILGAGHNDILMIFFMMLAYYMYLQKRFFLFGTVIALSVQTKIIPLFLLMFIVGKLITDKKIKEIITLSVPFLIVNSVGFYLMQLSPLQYIQRLLYNTGINWQSLQALMSRFGIEAHGLFTILFLLCIISVFVLQLIKKTDPITSYVTLIIIYLLFIASAYWNWYVLWILVFLPFIKNKRLVTLGIVFSFTSLFAYPIYWTSLRFNYQHIIWAVILYIAIFIVPLVAFYFKKPAINISIGGENKLH